MTHRILIIEGHPDGTAPHFGGALADAYAEGAAASGHDIDRIVVAALEFPLLRSKSVWETGAPPPAIRAAQERITAADHLVILYPLWLGTMPALLKSFLEQVFRPGFAIAATAPGQWRRLLTGKSARIVVTMGMPALVYRWYFAAHGLKALERNILAFCGIGPIRTSLIGRVETRSPASRQRWLARMAALGRAGR